MTTLYTEPKKAISVSTMQLQAGDTVQFGDIINGFWSNVILQIEPSPFKKSRMAITFLTQRGGIYTDFVAKNTHWSVVK